MALICYAKRLIFEPAAAIDAAVELVLGAAGLPAAVAELLGAGGGCNPMSCSSALKAFPNRFCAEPTGICAAVLLPESADKSSGEPFLWPCG